MTNEKDERLEQANIHIVLLKAALYKILHEMDKATSFNANTTPFWEASELLEKIDGKTEFKDRMGYK